MVKDARLLVREFQSKNLGSVEIICWCLSFCSENGFEEGLSLLGLVSGLFNAVWSLGYVENHTLTLSICPFLLLLYRSIGNLPFAQLWTVSKNPTACFASTLSAILFYVFE